MNEPIAYLRDIDGSGSLNLCAKNDPGAIAVYARNADLRRCAKQADIDKELVEALEKAQEDINWMVNEQEVLARETFDYIDSVLAKTQ